MSTKLTIIQKLDAAAPAQIVNLPEVADRFKALYVTFNGKDGARYYEAEKFHFAKLIQESPKLKECTKLSLYGCFLDVAVNGLSFDPAMKHVYLVPYKHKVVTNNVEKWETRAQLQISGIGELLLRMQQGQIKYADNPVLVYDGDVFRMGTRNDRIFIEHEVVLPRKSESIIACYLRITRNDDTVDYKLLTMPEIEKLRKFSKDPNSKAWTDGLPGMVQTKTIKHAFKTYPKLRILEKSKFTQLASDTIEEEAVVFEDIYGLNDNMPLPDNSGSDQFQPADVVTSNVPVSAGDEFTQKGIHGSSNGKVITDDEF